MYTYEVESNKTCKSKKYFYKIKNEKTCLAAEDRTHELQYKSEEIIQNVAQRDNKYGKYRRKGKSYDVVR